MPAGVILPAAVISTIPATGQTLIKKAGSER